MIKGLAITPPILGRISIGKVVEKTVNDCLKRTTNLPLPVKSKAKRGGSNIRLMSNYAVKHRIKNSVPFQ